MKFDMKGPCDNCPFRKDRPFHLRAARAREIADTLATQDGTFMCHKTIDYSHEGDMAERPLDVAEQHCGGALVILERMERPNQMMRIAERLGGYDRHQLDMDAPVYADMDEFVVAIEKLNKAPSRPRTRGRTGPLVSR